MSTQARPSTSFENRGHGTQNANTGDGPQNNNNSTGGQYNIFGNAWISASGQFDASLQSGEGDNEILQSLAFPEMLDRRNNIEPRHGSTCQWILELEEYKTWMSNATGLLWIKGKPGAGKSTLMAFLHGELTESPEAGLGVRLDFFFTARGTEMQRTPMGMLRSLTSQIFLHDESVRSMVREVYGRKCRQFGHGERKWEWQQLELQTLLAECILFAAERQQVTVFVDALDEAGGESAQALAKYFHQINARATQAKANVRICISCRHYPVASTVPGIEVWVENHNGKDIAAYVNDHLRPEELDAENSPDQAAWTALRDELIERAQGVFQWAHILTPLIRDMAQDGKSPQEVRDWLHQVPPELEGVYEYVFDRVIKPAEREQSLLLFQWVCLAERPLTVTEIRHAMAVKDAQVTPYQRRCQDTPSFVKSNERMKRRIKALSGGLVEVISGSEGDETVQVVHQSVNDFLRDKGLGYLARLVGVSQCTGLDRAGSDGCEVVNQCQATLYRSCLVYLATENVTPTLDNSTGKDTDDRSRLLAQSPFLDYAAVNLFIHAEKACGYRANAIEGEVALLQAYLDRWVRIYRVLGPWSTRPERGTTLLHMASAANLTDLVEHLTLAGEAMHAKDGKGETAFHAAARGGHVQVGEILYKKGADFEARSNAGKSPLLEAASHGRVKFVEWLLNKGARVNSPGRSGSPLQAAALQGRRQVVEVLLAAGADVNAQGGEYGNALQAASYEGSGEVVRMLLDANADVNAQGGEYGNALQAASYEGSGEVVRMLLDAHADVNAQGGEYGNALQAASFSGNSEVVRMLLDAHAGVNAQGGEYGNALQAASYKGSGEVMRMLLDAHADVNARGGYYGNALQAASARGTSKVVRMLLDAHADVNARGGYYGNALQAASARGNSEVVRMLLDAYADVNAQGGEYGNALQAASFSGNSEVVRMLLDAYAGVNAQGGEYGNALQAASFSGNSEVVRMLLDAYADVNAQGGEYGNALQAASYNGNSEVVRMLLDANADVNAQGGEYGNALQAASYEGSGEVVRMLLDAHADVNAQGGRYGNALQAASLSGNSEVVRMLLDAHADVNIQGGRYGNALQATSSRGNSEVVRILLDAHADINIQGGRYGNALQAASFSGNSELVRMLLYAHADVNAQGGIYGNALQAASYKGHSQVVQILLDAHADVNAQGGIYGNALQAASYEGSGEVVQMLLDAHADVNAQGGRYGNALQAASFSGNSELVRILLDAHADVNAQGGIYGNALQSASLSGNSEVVRMLLDAYADVNAQGGEYGTPLLAAVTESYTEIIQILLQSRANPCLSDHLGATPLHIAACRGQLDLLTRFPAFGASMNTQDKLLRTPLHLALYHGHVEFAVALLKNGSDPLLLDCFGRNAMDWALGYDMLVDLLRNVCPAIALTRKETQITALRQSVRELSAMLLHTGASASATSRAFTSDPIIRHLGRCLLFLGELDSARYLFRLCLSTLICDACHFPYLNSLSHCTVCADVEFCSSCVEQNSYHSKLCPGQRHEFLEVSNLPQQNRLVEGTLSEQRTIFLRGLMGQFGEPSSGPTEDCNPCHSPMADEQSKVRRNTELEHMDVATNIVDGSQILVSFAVIGLSVVLVRSLYHHFR